MGRLKHDLGCAGVGRTLMRAATWIVVASLGSMAAGQAPDPSPSPTDSRQQVEIVALPSASVELLERLLADYRSYGLPIPPREAELVSRKSLTGTVNGVEGFSISVAWRETKGDQKLYWIGFDRSPLDRDAVERIVSPQTGAEELQRSSPARGESGRDGFPVDQLLALAVQCHERGWNDAAVQLLIRSRQPSEEIFSRTFRRPEDDHAALARSAWNYWSNQFARRQDDRQVVLEHLVQLSTGPFGLNTPACRNVLDDMRQTLAPRNGPAGEYESLIDGLSDLGTKEAGGRRGFAPVQWAIRDSDECRKLREAGLDAVPALISHLDDFRMTRCIEQSSRGDWNARIADVMAALLNEFVPDEFSYDFLVERGRGKQLDHAHVMHWWNNVRQGEALEYLKTHAIALNARQELVLNPALARSLGRQHPEAYLELFEKFCEALEDNDGLFEILAASNVPRDAQIRLLLAASRSPRMENRIQAVDFLFPLDASTSKALLIKELDDLPVAPPEAYWHSRTVQWARIVRHTDDPLVWEALRRTIHRVDLGHRMQLLQEVAGIENQDPLVIQNLAEFLDSTEVRIIPAGDEGLFEGPCAGFLWDTLAVRDFAAHLLALQLDLDVDPLVSWQESDWSALRSTVKQVLATRNVQGKE